MEKEIKDKIVKLISEVVPSEEASGFADQLIAELGLNAVVPVMFPVVSPMIHVGDSCASPALLLHRNDEALSILRPLLG